MDLLKGLFSYHTKVTPPPTPDCWVTHERTMQVRSYVPDNTATSDNNGQQNLPQFLHLVAPGVEELLNYTHFLRGNQAEQLFADLGISSPQELLGEEFIVLYSGLSVVGIETSNGTVFKGAN